MATKLRNLRIRKVDFVDQGANPDAHIGMAKRKDSSGDGGDPADQVQDSSGEKNPGIWKKLASLIAKAAGMGQEEFNSAMEEIEKDGSTSFNERLNEAKNRKVADEIWDLCYALQSSLCSILYDEELDSDGSLSAMQGSVDEFCGVVKESVQQWSEGKAASIVMKREDMTDTELEIMKSARDRLMETIEKASSEAGELGAGEPENNIEQPKGDEGMGIRIDKSRMTPVERALLESIEKNYGVDDGGAEPPGNGGVEKKADPNGDGPGGGKEEEGGDGKKPGVKKSMESFPASAGGDAPDDIYKGLHPAVRAEIESLRKYRLDAEDRELHEVAKKYAIIGKKEDELVPLLKSVKAAGGTAYNDMIAVLDQTVEAVEKSGAFSEIGKAGRDSYGATSSEAKIAGIAKGYIEKDPSLSYSEAVAKAWEENPDILDAYDEEAGF